MSAINSDNTGSFDWQGNEETVVNPLLEGYGRVDYDIDVDNSFYEKLDYKDCITSMNQIQ